MPNLFSTFGRAALVAIGLTVAPAAFAQGTFTCPNGFSPIFTGTGTQSLEATCGVTCPSGQVTAVDANNNVTCSAGVPTNAAPSGCSLVASPTSGLSGAGTTLTAKCTAGNPTALTLTWTIPNGTPPSGGCSTSGTVGANTTCAISNITAGTTFSVKFSNGVGTDVTKSAAYAVNAGGGGSGNFANCPSGSITSSNFYPKATDQSMADFGAVSAGKFYSFKITVPANANVTVNQALKVLASYGSTGASMRWNISETACDINPANGADFGTPIVDAVSTTVGKSLKYMKGYLTPNLDKTYNYGPAGTQVISGTVGVSGMKTMEVGKTYYFNILYDSCPSGSCSLDSLKLP